MEVETLTNLISTVGFPIFVCLVLFWFIKTYLDKFINTLGDFNQSLDTNSKQLEKLSDRLLEVNKNV